MRVDRGISEQEDVHDGDDGDDDDDEDGVDGFDGGISEQEENSDDGCLS